MTKKYFERVFKKAVKEYRRLAPKDTGNLAYNAIKYKWLDDKTFQIYVDEGDRDASEKVTGVAPYMPFTNEPWLSPRWNGKQNPNESWWNKASEFIIGYIAKQLKGQLNDRNETN